MRDRLIELIGSKVCGDYSPSCDEWQPHSCEKCYANDCRIGELADSLLANGVIVPPCKVGDTIYRIDIKPQKCSQFKVYTKDEYYCANELNCYLYGTPSCDCGEEAYIFTIPNADIKTIVCSMDKLGKTVFLTREEAEAALKERNSKMTKEKQIEEMAKIIYDADILCDTCGDDSNSYCSEAIADLLVSAGYRKQSEGEWKFEHNPINDPKGYFIRIVCSCCGLKTGQVSNFCPKCGAKMKGGERE